MLLIKRIICGAVALLLIIVGIMLIHNSLQLWQALGFCFFIAGITLGYIAIMQVMPNYTFWITLIAIGLAYALFEVKTNNVPLEEQEEISAKLNEELERSKQLMGQNKKTEEKKKTPKKTGFNLAAYPKISGSATVLHAHIFYISGRYVRLFGVDAPDNDQVCSDSMGSSYNCGSEAASWVRGWIDKNQIDCYLVKVNPQGQDLAICVWDKYDIGAALVEAGWGLAKTSETDIYKPYEVKAQSESSGLWQGTFYSPEDWRDIKRHRNDFTLKRRTVSKSSGFFNFGSWFK